MGKIPRDAKRGSSGSFLKVSASKNVEKRKQPTNAIEVDSTNSSAGKNTHHLPSKSNQGAMKKKKKPSIVDSQPLAKKHKSEKGEGRASIAGQMKCATPKEGQKAPFCKTASAVHDEGSDSAAIGRELFRMLIAPTTLEDFFENYYQKKPLLVARGNPAYYADWMSMKDVRSLVDCGSLEWSTEARNPPPSSCSSPLRMY